MNKIATICLTAALAVSANTPALADRGGHDGYRQQGYHRHYYQPHRSHSNWVGPAAVLGIGGLIIGSAIASQYYSAPAPVYRAPPPPAPPRASYDTWYYCASSGLYYPYTSACPEGWQAVPAR